MISLEDVSVRDFYKGLVNFSKTSLDLKVVLSLFSGVWWETTVQMGCPTKCNSLCSMYCWQDEEPKVYQVKVERYLGATILKKHLVSIGTPEILFIEST